MNEYRIRRGTFIFDGQQVDGWLVFDTIAPQPALATLVAQILGGDSGQAFKELLLRAGMIEEHA
jgi:hypothetical protein